MSQDFDSDRRARSPVRSHVITHGRIRPTHEDLDRATLVFLTSAPRWGIGPDHRKVMDLCQDGPLTIADVADHLALPVAVVKILVSDLIDSGHLSRPAVVEPPAPELLKEVLDGLRSHLT